MEDPDYAKALYRKILILEKKGEFTNAHNMANFAITRYDDELEDPDNRKQVQFFREAKDRLVGQIPFEKKIKSDKAEKEVESEIASYGYNDSVFDELS